MLCCPVLFQARPIDALHCTCNVFNCSLCDVFLLPTERRKVFSSSSELVFPLLKQVVVDVFGKADKLRDVFILGLTLCHPYHRRLH